MRRTIYIPSQIALRKCISVPFTGGATISRKTFHFQPPRPPLAMPPPPPPLALRSYDYNTRCRAIIRTLLEMTERIKNRSVGINLLAGQYRRIFNTGSSLEFSRCIREASSGGISISNEDHVRFVREGWLVIVIVVVSIVEVPMDVGGRVLHPVQGEHFLDRLVAAEIGHVCNGVHALLRLPVSSRLFGLAYPGVS